MEIPPSTPAKIDQPQGPHDKTKLPWPQLRLTGSAFQEATDQMEMVFGRNNGEGDPFAIREFISAHQLTGPRRPGHISHVSADRACQLLFDWVGETKIRRRDAEEQRMAAYFSAAAQSFPTGNTNPLEKWESLNQLHCKDILILLTCIFGFQDVADLKRLARVAPHLVLLASLMHRLFYAPPGEFVYKAFRVEAIELLTDMGQYLGVEFYGR